MIIVCPHCQTRYEVAADLFGSASRKVQCAQCQRAWRAQRALGAAEDDALFTPEAERELDIVFEAAAADEAAHSALVPFTGAGQPEEAVTSSRADPEAIRRLQTAFSRRHSVLVKRLPHARLRRGLRIGLVVLLLLLVAGAWLGRVALVRSYPELAGVYGALGVPVNIVGVEFSDVVAQRRSADAGDVLVISATVRSVADSEVAVPPVVLTLLNAEGASLYEWSVRTAAATLLPGGSAPVSAELAAPPEGVAMVRLSFTTAAPESQPPPIEPGE